MKFIKYFLLILCVVCLGSFSANALNVTEIDSEEYLLNHGHSKEVVRIINLQEKRAGGEQKEIENHSKFVKFWRNIFFEKDATLPLKDFGYNDIPTVESP